MLTLDLLEFNHHSAGGQIVFIVGQRFPPMIRLAGQAHPETIAVPPSASVIFPAVEGVGDIVVMVVCRKTHSVETSETIAPTGVEQPVPGVSAVAAHVNTILVVCLVADRE